MMAPGSAVVLLLLLQLGVASRATERDDDLLSSDGHLFPDANPHRLLREDRKLIFINNKAFDMSEEEQARLWDIYIKKGHVPDTQNLDNNSHMDSLEAAMMATATSRPGNAQAITTDADAQVIDDFIRARNDKFSDRTISHREPIKSSRFVANPDKVHLIEVVDKAEVEELRLTTSAPKIDERVATEASPESATVHYEATQVSVLSFLWTELKNIGELLGREMLDTLSARLWYLWKSLVKVVQARGRRAILDQSSEL